MIIFSLLLMALPAIFSLPSSGCKNISSCPYTDDSLKIVAKVYLHTDRDSYYPGDDIWFKGKRYVCNECVLTNLCTGCHESTGQVK
jgi:hypothetical protein